MPTNEPETHDDAFENAIAVIRNNLRGASTISITVESPTYEPLSKFCPRRVKIVAEWPEKSAETKDKPESADD